MLDAVADAMPRAAPLATRRSPARAVTSAPASHRVDPDFTRRLEERVARARARGTDDRPQLVNLALRVEADEEELVAGAVRLVLQVVAADNAAHVADAALLWTESDEPGSSHGFGDRARTHASIALRAAAEAWPVLDRLLALRVPDQITLDSDELLSLLDGGALALDAMGVQVLWPRYLDRDVTSRVVLSGPRTTREEPLQTGLFGPDALFGFSWQLALHGDALTDDEMDELATAATPIIKIRDNWTIVDSAVLKRARKRLIKRVAPAAALAATLTEVVQVEDVEHQAVVGASLLKVRDQLLTAAVRDPIEVPTGLAATLRDYQRHGFSWLAELTGLGLGACLADDMGLGKTITLIALHLHRHEPGGPGGPTLVVCPASLLG
ncbi:SNF2 helicase-associated domain-containing protein, partial [Nocardioides sp. P5_C9_2]